MKIAIDLYPNGENAWEKCEDQGKLSKMMNIQI